MRVELPSGTPAELALPAGAPTRGVALAPDIMGLRPLFDDLCARLAADHGWAVCAAEPFRPAPGVVDRAGPADVMLELALELRDELRIAPVPSVLLTQLVERMDQRLGDEHASVRAEMAALVG